MPESPCAALEAGTVLFFFLHPDKLGGVVGQTGLAGLHETSLMRRAESVFVFAGCSMRERQT